MAQSLEQQLVKKTMSSIIPDSIRQKEKLKKGKLQINRTYISPRELEAVLTSRKD